METFEQKIAPIYQEIVKKEKEALEAKIDAFDEKQWDEALMGKIETPLKNREQLKKEVRSELLKSLEPDEDYDIVKGFTLIFDNSNYILSSDEEEAFRKEVKTLSKEEKSTSTDPATTLAKKLKLSDHFLFCIEKIAIDYYNKNLYKEARHIFYLLTQLNPYISDYFINLGHTEQALDNIVGATNAYLFAGFTDIENPLPYLLAAHINTEKEPLHAQNFLNVAKTIIENSPDKTQYEQEVAALDQALVSKEEV